MLKVKNDVFKTTSLLMSANKKVSWKKQALTTSSSTWKLAKTILNVLRVEPSIF